MKRIVPCLSGLASLGLAVVAAAALAGCDGGGGGANDLVAHPNQIAVDPTSLAAGSNTQHHFQDPNAGTGINGISDPAVVQATSQVIGSPEVVARLHSCSKIPYASLGGLLASRGVNIQPAAKGSSGPATAGTIYAEGAAALGIADYAGRVPEMVLASTSAMAKEFDIFVAAAAEVQANLSTTTACPGVTIADANGVFTLDGISCIMGKPATPAHVTLANQLVQAAPDVNTGVQLAIAALLEAAHTCE
jgi:hypothetical protein